MRWKKHLGPQQIASTPSQENQRLTRYYPPFHWCDHSPFHSFQVDHESTRFLVFDIRNKLDPFFAPLAIAPSEPLGGGMSIERAVCSAAIRARSHGAGACLLPNAASNTKEASTKKAALARCMDFIGNPRPRLCRPSLLVLVKWLLKHSAVGMTSSHKPQHRPSVLYRRWLRPVSPRGDLREIEVL